MGFGCAEGFKCYVDESISIVVVLVVVAARVCCISMNTFTSSGLLFFSALLIMSVRSKHKQIDR